MRSNHKFNIVTDICEICGCHKRVKPHVTARQSILMRGRQMFTHEYSADGKNWQKEHINCLPKPQHFNEKGKSEPNEVTWVCNSCNFPNFTTSVSQAEIDAELHACIHCGGFEFHLSKKTDYTQTGLK